MVRKTRSAYLEALGSEPPITNHSFNGKFGEFSGCLDYIFVSPQWKVNSVRALPSVEAMAAVGPLPAKDEPSDHLLLAAELTLPPK